MASKGAHKRLTKEYLALQKEPVPFIKAKPLESNILEWHFVITGPPDTPYHDGQYHGKLLFPHDYPFKPPSIKMCTPSGRFIPNARICLSMSDFHPATWNPSWSVATILNGLISFMVSTDDTVGSMKSTIHEKRQFAQSSYSVNRSNSKFREVFPELVHKPIPFIRDISASLPQIKLHQQQQQPQKVVTPKQKKESHPTPLQYEAKGHFTVTAIIAIVLLSIAFGWYKTTTI